LAESDPDKLVEIADGTAWPGLIGSISRALAHQMGEEPEALDPCSAFLKATTGHGEAPSLPA